MCFAHLLFNTVGDTTMKLLRALLAFTLVGFVSVNAMAQEHGTKDEAKAMADKAVAYIKSAGTEKAFKDFTNDKASWTKKDMYVYVTDFQGNILAHGANEKLVGKSLLEIKDQNGKQFIKEAIEVVKSKGSGWIDYDWAHPQTKKVEGKTTYVLKAGSFDGFVAVGVYR